MANFRLSMGDFSLINTVTGFQYGQDGVPFSTFEQYLAYFVFVVSAMNLFMIMMNFIIAVIGNSYSKIIEYAEAHDFREKVELIFERE